MRTKKGVVTGTKMTGTVTVTVHSHALHPVYKKRFRKSKKFLADPGEHDLYIGDLVTITECRPLSKNKNFRVTQILQQAPRVDDLNEEKEIEEVVHREKVSPEPKGEKEEEVEEVKVDESKSDEATSSTES